jgi:hypothetical protein
MDEAIEDGVCVGGIADHRVPFVDRQLAGEDCGAAAVAFFEDFEEIVAALGPSSQRSTIKTPASTLALSRGLRGRAGRMAMS